METATTGGWSRYRSDAAERALHVGCRKELYEKLYPETTRAKRPALDRPEERKTGLDQATS